MVGGQQIDGAVSYGCDGCLAILFGAQRRIHLGKRAVFQQRLIAQRNIMRCGFARNRQSFSFGLANRVEGNRSADMLEVHVHAGLTCHLNVTFDDLQFGVFGNAGDTQFS